MYASRANKYENGDANGLDVLNNAGHHLQNPELVDLMDDGIDIVRIKTTEEVSFFVLSAFTFFLACKTCQNCQDVICHRDAKRKQC